MYNQAHILNLLEKLIIKILNLNFFDIVRISKYKNIFSKGFIQIGLKGLLWLKKLKKNVPWTYVINDLKGEEIVGMFYVKELQETNQQEFRVENVIKRKGNKLYVKWKGFYSSFSSSIDKKDVV